MTVSPPPAYGPWKSTEVIYRASRSHQRPPSWTNSQITERVKKSEGSPSSAVSYSPRWCDPSATSVPVWEENKEENKYYCNCTTPQMTRCKIVISNKGWNYDMAALQGLNVDRNTKPWEAAAADLSSGINEGSQPHHLFCRNCCHRDVGGAVGECWESPRTPSLPAKAARSFVPRAGSCTSESPLQGSSVYELLLSEDKECIDSDGAFYSLSL